MQPELDVYQPPKANLDAVSALQPKLYTWQQVAVATVIGSPIAGCLLLASNAAAKGKLKERLQMIVVGAVATVALLALALILPKNFPNTVLPVAYTIALRQYAKGLEGETPPPSRQSWWKVVGIGLGSLVALLVLLGFYVFVTNPE